MLVLPLERIFYTIRTNAAQVVAALGPEVRSPGGCALHTQELGMPAGGCEVWQRHEH